MSARTPVFVVCSPLERVGKTLIARLLAEFFTADDRPVDCFDLNTDRPSLADYLPERTVAATLRDTRAQMALFDRLIQADDVPKVVDLGHGAFEQFFTVSAQVRFGEEAQRRRIQVVILFVASPSPVAAQAYSTLLRWLPGIVLVPVHNEVLGRSFAREKYPTASGPSLPLRIPVLAPGLHRIVVHPAFSFSAFRARKFHEISAPYQTELDSWMKRVFVEFRELELRLLLATLRLSLQH